MRVLALSAAALLLLLTACGGDEDPLPDGGSVADSGPRPDGSVPSDSGVLPDGGSTPDSGTPTVVPCDVAQMPRLPNGPAGGDLSGDLTIFLVEDNLGGISDATVKAIAPDGATFEGVTDSNGCVRFVHGSLVAGTSVHAFAQARAFESDMNVLTAELTIAMLPMNGGPGVNATGSIEGVITNLDILTATSATIARAAVIDPMHVSVLIGAPQQPNRAGNQGVGENVILVGGNGNFAFDTFSAQGFFGTRGLVAVAGLFYTPPLQQGRFEPSHMGFVTGLNLQDGDALTGQDVTLTNPLTESLTVSYQGTNPTGLDVTTVWGMVTMANNAGQFVRGFTDAPQAGMAIFEDFPSLDGPLSGAQYGSIVQFGNADNSRFSQRFDLGGSNTMLTVPAPAAIPSMAAVSGRTVTVTLDSAASDVAVVIVQSGAQVLWRAVVRLPGTGVSMQFPSVPAGFTDPLLGELDTTIFAVGYEGFIATEDAGETLATKLRTRTLITERLTFEDPNLPPNPYACSMSDPGPLPGAGGATGGPITGSFVLHTVAAESQTALANVTVLIDSASSTTTISARTGPDGCIEVPNLTGPIDVHIMATGRTYVSQFGFNAARQTLPLQLLGQNVQFAPDNGTISGLVLGLDVLGATTASTGQAAFVEAVVTDLFAPDPEQAQRMNAGFATNVVAIHPDTGLDLDAYALAVNPEKVLGVAARGGLFDVASGQVTLARVGLAGVTSPPSPIVGPGATLTGQDVQLTDDIDTVLSITHNDVGLTDRVVLPFIALPSAGLVTADLIAEPGTTATASVASLTGPFVGSTYGAAVQMGSAGLLSLLVHYGDASPTMTLALSELPTSIAATGRTLSVDLPSGLDVAGFVVGAGGSERWIVQVFNAAASVSATLPAVPQGLSDPLVGTANLRASGTGFAPGFDPFEVSGRDVVQALRVIVENNSDVTF